MKKLFLYIILFLGIFGLCYLLANAYFGQSTQKQPETEVQMMESAAYPAEKKQESYVIGISDNHVIVYVADTKQVYEYTEIDVDVLKRLHPKIYEDLLENVYFDSREDVYRYLESIST